jgi:hypothetical protein
MSSPIHHRGPATPRNHVADHFRMHGEPAPRVAGLRGMLDKYLPVSDLKEMMPFRTKADAIKQSFDADPLSWEQRPLSAEQARPLPPSNLGLTRSPSRVSHLFVFYTAFHLTMPLSKLSPSGSIQVVSTHTGGMETTAAERFLCCLLSSPSNVDAVKRGCLQTCLPSNMDAGYTYAVDTGVQADHEGKGDDAHSMHTCPADVARMPCRSFMPQQMLRICNVSQYCCLSHSQTSSKPRCSQ